MWFKFNKGEKIEKNDWGSNISKYYKVHADSIIEFVSNLIHTLVFGVIILIEGNGFAKNFQNYIRIGFLIEISRMFQKL